VVQSVNSYSFVGAGSLMLIHHYLDQQFPPDSKISFGSRHPNPPILEETHYLSIKPVSEFRYIQIGAVYVNNTGN
jgi:hypothetical protein